MSVGTGSNDGAIGGYKVKQPLIWCANQHLNTSIYWVTIYKVVVGCITAPCSM